MRRQSGEYAEQPVVTVTACWTHLFAPANVLDGNVDREESVDPYANYNNLSGGYAEAVACPNGYAGKSVKFVPAIGINDH